MEVTDRPLFALIPVFAATLAVLLVAIFRGSEDAVAVLFPSFLTILPLLRASPTASYLAAGLLAVIGIAEYCLRRALPAAGGSAAGLGRPCARRVGPAGCRAPRAAGVPRARRVRQRWRAGRGDHRRRPRPPVRTLYVQAPLSGPAADEGRAMVDAVRLIVDQRAAPPGARA